MAASWVHITLYGVVTAISIGTGKCLAYECLVKNCKSCEMWASRRGTLEYENFVKEHNGPINHGDRPVPWRLLVCCVFLRSMPLS